MGGEEMDVRFDESAEMKMRMMSEDGRRAVSWWIDYLRKWDTDPTARQYSTERGAVEGVGGGVYEMNTTDDYVIFFQLGAGAITVLDVTRGAWLRAARERLAEAR